MVAKEAFFDDRLELPDRRVSDKDPVSSIWLLKELLHPRVPR